MLSGTRKDKWIDVLISTLRQCSARLTHTSRWLPFSVVRFLPFHSQAHFLCFASRESLLCLRKYHTEVHDDYDDDDDDVWWESKKIVVNENTHTMWQLLDFKTMARARSCTHCFRIFQVHWASYRDNLTVSLFCSKCAPSESHFFCFKARNLNWIAHLPQGRSYHNSQEYEHAKRKKRKKKEKDNTSIYTHRVVSYALIPMTVTMFSSLKDLHIWDIKRMPNLVVLLLFVWNMRTASIVRAIECHVSMSSNSFAVVSKVCSFALMFVLLCSFQLIQ